MAKLAWRACHIASLRKRNNMVRGRFRRTRSDASGTDDEIDIRSSFYLGNAY